jgi:general secretion pathway protein K
LKAEPADIQAPLPSSGTRGFIVIAVLWILAVLSALVLIYLTYVINTAVLVAGTNDRIQTDTLVSAGVELAAYQVLAAKEDKRRTNGTFDARVGPAKISVTFRSEAARIDLNAAPKPLLVGFLTGLGVAPPDASDYADRIVAWRSPTEQADNDPENSFYRTSGAAYLPRHAPFPAAEELWLLRGIPPFIIQKMLPFVTVFSSMATINIVEAEPQVIAGLPGMTPESLQSVLVQRSDPTQDPQTVLALAGSGTGATIDPSKAYRITVAVTPDKGRRATSEAVILLLEDGDEPYRVLSWRNGSDGSTAPQEAILR